MDHAPISFGLPGLPILDAVSSKLRQCNDSGNNRLSFYQIVELLSARDVRAKSTRL